MNKTNSNDKNYIENLSRKVLESSYRVHTWLGPGLFESVYEACLIRDLQNYGVKVDSQVGQPVYYMGEKIDLGFRLDLLVEKSLIIEIKAVETIKPLHRAQLLSYLKLSGLHLGLLINFNTVSLKNGISRIINGYL